MAHVSGSHCKLVREEDPPRMVVVPFHGKLRTGTLRAILKAAGLGIEEFLEVFMVP